MPATALFSTFDVTVLKGAPTKIEITGNKEQIVGIHNVLELEITGVDCNQDVVWSSSDDTMVLIKYGLILGLQEGSVTIFATSVADNKIFGEIELTFNKQNNNI